GVNGPEPGGVGARLDSHNGTQGDRAQQLLVWKGDKTGVPALKKLLRDGQRGEARLHALCTLDLLGALRPADVLRALDDRHPGVRRHAVRLSEKWLKDDAELATAVLARARDADAAVRIQTAYTLGEYDDSRASKALAALATGSAA